VTIVITMDQETVTRALATIGKILASTTIMEAIRVLKPMRIAVVTTNNRRAGTIRPLRRTIRHQTNATHRDPAMGRSRTTQARRQDTKHRRRGIENTDTLCGASEKWLFEVGGFDEIFVSCFDSVDRLRFVTFVCDGRSKWSPWVPTTAALSFRIEREQRKTRQPMFAHIVTRDVIER
jgi:hypothetical protein